MGLCYGKWSSGPLICFNDASNAFLIDICCKYNLCRRRSGNVLGSLWPSNSPLLEGQGGGATPSSSANKALFLATPPSPFKLSTPVKNPHTPASQRRRSSRHGAAGALDISIWFLFSKKNITSPYLWWHGSLKSKIDLRLVQCAPHALLECNFS